MYMTIEAERFGIMFILLSIYRVSKPRVYVANPQEQSHCIRLVSTEKAHLIYRDQSVASTSILRFRSESIVTNSMSYRLVPGPS